MAEIISQIGRLEPGNYWVLDVLCDVQVGWINRDTNDGQWYILDGDSKRKAGPFKTLKEASGLVDDVLSDEFGIGSPAN